MDKLVEQAIVHLANNTYSDWAWAHKEVVKSSTFRELLQKEIKRIKNEAQQKEYHYMITFTVSPTLHPTIDNETEKQIEDYIRSQSDRTGLHVKEMHYVKELHKNGRPHWHVSVTTTKAIKKALFSYYQKIYGNIDFSRSKGKNNQDALAYMSKSGTPTKLKKVAL
ncbi:MAG: replicase [Virus sp.]|nr:MAG: replicase [Virus sp.]